MDTGLVPFRLLFEDFLTPENNPIFESYLASLTLNIVLKNLTKNERQELMEYVSKNQPEQIQKYVLDKIPDLKKMLQRALSQDMREAVYG